MILKPTPEMSEQLNRPGKAVRFSIGSQASNPISEAITASNIKNNLKLAYPETDLAYYFWLANNKNKLTVDSYLEVQHYRHYLGSWEKYFLLQCNHNPPTAICNISRNVEHRKMSSLLEILQTQRKLIKRCVNISKSTKMYNNQNHCMKS